LEELAELEAVAPDAATAPFAFRALSSVVELPLEDVLAELLLLPALAARLLLEPWDFEAAAFRAASCVVLLALAALDEELLLLPELAARLLLEPWDFEAAAFNELLDAEAFVVPEFLLSKEEADWLLFFAELLLLVSVMAAFFEAEELVLKLLLLALSLV
jgi:hypothetical protein